MAATSSTVAMLPYFDGGYCCAGGSYTDPISAYTSGSTTVTQLGSSSLYFGDFSTHLPGGEISMNGVDSVDVAFAAPKKRPSSCSERRCVRSICKAPPATRTPS